MEKENKLKQQIEELSGKLNSVANQLGHVFDKQYVTRDAEVLVEFPKGFEEELSEKLLPYRGSLCMASAGTGTSSLGSQFFITQAHYDEEMATILEQYDWPTEIIDMYKKHGGYMSLYQGYTIFGQVIDGMDVVDEIAKTKTNASDKPLEDVVIESIEVKEYKK